MIRSDTRDRPVARQVLLAGLLLGLLAELTFDGPALGIGVPIFIAAVLVAGWLVRRPGRGPDPFDAWLPIAAVVLAALVAVRADPFLAALDVTLAFALVGASLAAMSGLAVTKRSASVIGMMAVWGLGAVFLGAVRMVSLVRPTSEQLTRSVPSWIAPIGRGLIVGIPLGLILVVLFASADPIFSDTIANVLGFRLDLGDLPGRLSFALAAAWLVTGAISIASMGMPALEGASLGAAVRTRSLTVAGSLGLPEALVIWP